MELLAAILAFLQALIKPAEDGIAAYILWRAGQMSAVNESLERQNEILKKQADLAAQPLPDPVSVRDRMRDGEL